MQDPETPLEVAEEGETDGGVGDDLPIAAHNMAVTASNTAESTPRPWTTVIVRPWAATTE